VCILFNLVRIVTDVGSSEHGNKFSGSNVMNFLTELLKKGSAPWS
jgi:hypothetical protein